MNAAIDLPNGFHTVPHDPAVAVRADRRQRVDRAFEAIECVMFSGYDHFKRPCHIHSRKLRHVAILILSRLDSLAAVSTCLSRE